MSRTIDADALINRIVFHTDWTTDEKEAFEDEINAEPTIEERKKGKWKGYNDGDPNWQRDDGSPMFLICSECHGTVINSGSAHWNFCPKCGSRNR